MENFLCDNIPELPARAATCKDLLDRCQEYFGLCKECGQYKLEWNLYCSTFISRIYNHPELQHIHWLLFDLDVLDIDTYCSLYVLGTEHDTVEVLVDKFVEIAKDSTYIAFYLPIVLTTCYKNPDESKGLTENIMDRLLAGYHWATLMRIR